MKGYVLEGILPNSQEQIYEPREVYINMNRTGLNVYLSRNDEEAEEMFDMGDLMWPCDSEYPCPPNEFKEKMMNKIQIIGGEQMNEKITLLR